jgi:UDP-N-acetylmuramate-alanine ligase
MNIIIGEDNTRITKDFESIIFSEAIPENQKERQKAKVLGIPCFSYPEALGFITDDKKLISIA